MKRKRRKNSSTPQRENPDDAIVALLTTTASALYGIRLFVLDTLWNLKRPQRTKRRKNR